MRKIGACISSGVSNAENRRYADLRSGKSITQKIGGTLPYHRPKKTFIKSLFELVVLVLHFLILQPFYQNH